MKKSSKKPSGAKSSKKSNAKGHDVKKSSKRSKSKRSHHSSGGAKSSKRRGRRRSSSRGFSMLGALVAVGAGAVGVIGGVMLRNHAPDFVANHPIASGIAITAAGVGGGAALQHFGHPVAGTAVMAAVGGMGATELVGAGLALLSADKAPDDPNKPSTNPAGYPMPSIGPTNDVTPVLNGAKGALGQAEGAIGSAIDTLLGWANGQANPTDQPSNGHNASSPYPQVAALPNGYQDPLGAAVGILQTLGAHVMNPQTGTPYAPQGGDAQDPAAALAWVLSQMGYSGDNPPPQTTAADGSPTLAQQLGAPNSSIPTPYGNVALNQYGLPGDMLPPTSWPVGRVINRPVARVIRRPIGRVISTPFG